MRDRVPSVVSMRSSASRSPHQPKSRAATIDNRYRPILVGEVRCAITARGSSWKLSGGRWLSSAVTKVSKKRQVRRAISLSSRCCSADNSDFAAEGGVWLIRHAMAGAATHSSRKGIDIAGSEPRNSTISNARPSCQQHAAEHARVETAQRIARIAEQVRGNPLEHEPASHEYPPQSAADGVTHEPGLVGEHAGEQRDLCQCQRRNRCARPADGCAG